MDTNTDTTSAEATGVDRRGALGAGAAGVAALAALAAGGLAGASTPAQAQGVTDVDIFNFALNLEYLEAEFYLRGVTGTGLTGTDITGTGTPGGVNGGAAVPFRSGYLQQYFSKIAVDELTHVRFIRAVLGSSAVARPAIDFTQAFTTLAIAAGLIVPGQTFNPFADEVSFLVASYVFEDVGVTAYAGSAGLISSPTNLAYAGSILAVEAYHAAAVRSLLANIGGGQATNQISALRAALSGRQDDLGVVAQGLNYNFVPVDDQGQAFRRTPRQVLNIVYGAQNAASGLFFPAGVNGAIRS